MIARQEREESFRRQMEEFIELKEKREEKNLKDLK